MKFQTNTDKLPHSAEEARYQTARTCLERAQADRKEAVCRFLEARAQLGIADLPDADSECLLACATEGSLDQLAQADAELRQAKILYSAALELSARQQRIVSQLRDSYQRAQEKLDRLAIEESDCPKPQSSGHYEVASRASRLDDRMR